MALCYTPSQGFHTLAFQVHFFVHTRINQIYANQLQIDCFKIVRPHQQYDLYVVHFVVHLIYMLRNNVVLQQFTFCFMAKECEA